MGERKLHYKMYKDGKKIVFAAIATFSILVAGGLSTVEVHADTVSENTSTATASSTSDMKSAAPSTATTAASRPVSADATSASSSSAVKSDTASTVSSSAAKSDTASTVSSSAAKSDTASTASSSAAKSDIASTASSSAAKSDTASTASNGAAKSDTASTASSSAAKSDTASTASSSAAKSDTASTASSSAAKSDTASTASSSAAKSDTANTASSSATKSTNVDASESSGTSENTTSSTNNTASSGDDDQSVDMNGIHHYIPLHPERGADPSDNRWGALMKYWDTWYGVGYQVSDSKPASSAPGNLIWPGSGSTAVWPVGSDYASMNRFITRTIEYRDKSTGELITGVTPVVQKVHYGVAFVMDLVTGEILGYMTPNTNGTFPDKPTIQHRADAWYVIGNSNFTAVTSPDLSSKGYLAPDLATVAQQKVNPGDQDDTVNVYYDHAVVPVNPTNPQTPGTPINPDDPDSPKWPVGTDKDSLTTDIHQTIHYQYGDGSQAAPDKTDSTTFEHQVEIDKVTGEVVKDDGWTAKNGKTSFDAKVSPVIAGYTASQASSTAVTGLTQDSQDNVQTIVYAPNAETANVTYIDDTTGKTLSTKDLSGAYGTTDPYRTNDTIAGYENAGYKLVSDNYPTSGVTYNEDSTVQSFQVHLTHSTTLTNETKIVTETIHYVYKDGTTAHDDYVAKPVEFTREVSTDAVTGEKTYGAWSAAQSFDAVKSPELKGYTADKAQIDKQTVNGDSKDLAFTVTYTKNAPTITTDKKTVNETIHYQGAGNQTPADHTASVDFTREVSTDAVTGEKTYGAWSAAQSFDAVKSPELKGYTADKAQIDKQTVNGDSKDLAFTVTYTKNAPTITTDKKTVNETIHYQGAGNQTPADHTASVDFTREVSTDAVTGEKTYGAWSAAQSFDAVKSPELKGYTADKAQIDKQTVNGDSKDLAFTVTYTKNAPVAGGNVTAKYVDENGNSIADDVIASGNVGDPYSTTQKDVPGYTFKEVQGNPTGSFTDQDQTVTYVYTKNPATDNNGGTGLNQPGKPGNGTDTGNSSSNQPGNPSQPSNATNNGVINTSTNTGSKVNNSAVNSPELPQTGENNSQSQTMSSIGILLAMFGSLLGFLGIKKRRND
ncbi:MucBP domain-containing protein (plasmid) [Lacticaseibacillus paracasei]|uniref:mucin-binding protein n=1 Tax=Lacticaseibacillus paracasei TaxID=1597 RepID=UPI00338FB209